MTYVSSPLTPATTTKPGINKMKSNSWEKFWKGNTAGSAGAFVTFPTIQQEGGVILFLPLQISKLAVRLINNFHLTPFLLLQNQSS